MITVEELRARLAYDPETGFFTWLRAPARGTAAGPAGSTNKVSGYACIGFNGHSYYAHRLAWLYMTGEWPKQQVDHINGVRHDNRWANLREADHRLNSQNRRAAHSRNKTQKLGVCFVRGKYLATIAVDGKTTRLGTFNTKDLAHAAYLEAKRQLHEGCTI